MEPLGRLDGEFYLRDKFLSRYVLILLLNIFEPQASPYVKALNIDRLDERPEKQLNNLFT